jgi:hypothetical protein
MVACPGERAEVDVQAVEPGLRPLASWAATGGSDTEAWMRTLAIEDAEQAPQAGVLRREMEQGTDNGVSNLASRETLTRIRRGEPLTAGQGRTWLDTQQDTRGGRLCWSGAVLAGGGR